MGREADNLEDERTWQQPMLGQGGLRPETQPTMRASVPDEGEAAEAPEATDVQRTSPRADASHVPEGSSTGDSAESDPQRTQALPREGTGEWDTQPPPVLEAGAVVFEKYRLIEKVGVGGMGEVWRVWHIHLETERALKLIRPELAQNDKGWRRFQREARVMAKINHPNAVAVYDFRRTQSVGYIEMEFVRGRSLSDVLKDHHGQPMPLDWTARVLEQLCAVLQEAHGHVDEATGKPRPIIHRDLKPSNLMLVEQKDDSGPPRLKVLDFGIAKIVEDEGSPELTGAGDLVGTPAYMSPEQIRGGLQHDGSYREIDARSDLYSAGVVLYHLLTGALPFLGSKMLLLASHLNNPPMPMREANPQARVPREVERVVLQCLEKDPDRRPHTARELSESFLQAAGVGPAVARRPPAEAARGRRVAAAALVIALVTIIGLGVVLLPRGDRRPPVAPPPGPHTGDGEPPEGPEAVVAARSAGPWEPVGYEALNPNDIVPDRPGFPVNLKRLDDGVTFVYRDGIYLPEGYDPESLDDLESGGWPRALVRRRDKVRFIRIQGGVYLRGDPRAGQPELDFEEKPITPHYVRVRGFYIQETEVTIGEVLDYAKQHVEDPDLRAWMSWLEGFQAGHPEPRYPAACINYRLAKRYARSVAGLIPTEAQWEYTGKSRHDDNLFAWVGGFTPTGAPPRARLNDPNAVGFERALVKEYPSDQTRQHVFDMVGNLRELCADPYIPYGKLRLAGNSRKNPLIDERRPVDQAGPDVRVVVRGGSFMCSEDRATAFFRWREPPGDLPADVGFRVVLECPEGDESSP
jgi:serine/threonine protein kinase/formylglycine-generating enzyme required for sulfatase activity